ncbi:MAG TPA: tRNA lysidine(34) synthetase TilS [Bacteroidia bacterium]|nr:tRNA lysidine(34) synthetase TilS [Bacteroidia bacterium]
MLSKESFRESLYGRCGLAQGETVLAGVSGGIDSMVMAWLLHAGEIPFAVAHVNYGLRGSESDEDEKFVAELAAEFSVPFYLKKCTAEEISPEDSVQQKARKIRYRFFENVRDVEGMSRIATAHNLNDSVETALLNFARGSGLKGLGGIAPVREKVIRPLLSFTRADILEFARKNKIRWREDSSNTTDHYTRNRFRHHLLPELANEIPQGFSGFEATFGHVADSRDMISAAMKRWESECCTTKENAVRISIGAMKNWENSILFLEYFLKEKGFARCERKEILSVLEGEKGKKAVAGELALTKEIDSLVLKNSAGEPDPSTCFTLREEKFSGTVPSGKWVAAVDAKKLNGPPHIRCWRTGDSMRPLGLHGKKKVSDILNELKIPSHLKRSAPVVVSGDEIIWVPGYRIAEKFRVTERTENVLLLEFNPSFFHG